MDKIKVAEELVKIAKELVARRRVKDLSVVGKEKTDGSYELEVSSPVRSVEMMVEEWMAMNQLKEKDGWASENNGNPHNWRVYNESNEISNSEMREFIKYFKSFYDKDGLYPIDNLTEKKIRDAVNIRMKKEPDVPFGGDSLDREWVRDIVLGVPMGQDA